MHLIETVAEMRAWRKEYGEFEIGLVTTMGYLHGGHISLVEKAIEENDLHVVSIFVNPTQFGPNEDFKTYPRDLARDLGLLRCCSVGAVFAPPPSEIYPEGFQTYIDVGEITTPLEGTARPGHFRGVATIVTKLFNIVQPTRAYFGQKDAQQVSVIKQMVRDLNTPTDIVVCPIVREPDGLAMSSRNTYLSPEEREKAIVLYRSLHRAMDLYGDGVRDAGRIKAAVLAILAEEPLASVEYVSVADNTTLRELEGSMDDCGETLVSMAVRFGSTRLIDNTVLGRPCDDVIGD